jgi:long-chain fatty acid transport protein
MMGSAVRQGLSRGRALSLFGTAAGLALTAAPPALASGFYLQEQSVRGYGRANSGEVADQGPASLWWNPAAIGWEEEDGAKLSASFGATGILPTGTVEDRGTQIVRPGAPPQPVGGGPLQSDPVQKGLLPSSAVALRLGDRLALGLAITSPYSFTSDYEETGWQRYSGIRTRLLTLDIQPSIAFAPTDWLSLGAGLNIEYSDAFLSNALPNLAPGSADGRIRLDASGWDVGWSAGVQLRPAPRVTLGLAYKSSVRHRIDGSVEISGLAGPLAGRNLEAASSARFRTPWQLTLGARAGIGESTFLNVQAVRVGWSKFDRIDLGPPLNSSIPEGYKDISSLAFGIDQGVGERLVLRAGIQFDATPTRDSTRDPRVPDGDRVNYTVGGSLRMGERLTLDAAAGLIVSGSGPIERDETFYAGTAAETRILSSGRVENSRVLVMALGGRLDF